jgi:hypothetical protein
MKLTFCAACGSKDDLQHHHLVTRSEGDSDDERNLITLCDPCRAKLRERRSDGPTAADRLNEAAGRRRFLSDLGGDRGPLRAISSAIKAKGFAISHEGVSRQACQSVPASQLRWRSRSANESLGEGRPGAQGQPRAVSNRRVTKPWSVSRSAKPRFEAIAATLPFGGVSYENKVASFKAAERMREPSRADN